MANIVIVFLLAIIVILDVRYLWKQKEKGCSDCSGSCDSCGPVCKFTEDINRAKREIQKGH